MTARISAVSSVKGGKSRRMIAMELQKGGPGEFWRDFPNRSLNYALAAVVSKSTVQLVQFQESVPGCIFFCPE